MKWWWGEWNEGQRLGPGDLQETVAMAPVKGVLGTRTGERKLERRVAMELTQGGGTREQGGYT